MIRPAVGGDILDMALSRANKNARFVMCGAISQYNSKDPKGPRVSHSIGCRIVSRLGTNK